MAFSRQKSDENKSSRPNAVDSDRETNDPAPVTTFVQKPEEKVTEKPGNSSKISLLTADPKVSDVINDNNHTKDNDDQSFRLDQMAFSRQKSDENKIRRSTRIGRGQKKCSNTCTGCLESTHATTRNHTPKMNRKPTRRPSERYVKSPFLKIINSIIKSPKTDNTSVSYGLDNKVQIKRKYEITEEPARNEASSEASNAETGNCTALKDKPQGQSRGPSNKNKKTKKNPQIP